MKIAGRESLTKDIRTKAFTGFFVLDDFSTQNKQKKVGIGKRTVTSTNRDEEEIIEDYRDVMITAMASTWAMDRDGERVRPGAFKDAIRQYMTNPVMLTDHVNSVSHVAGRYLSVKETESGLSVSALLSNAPDVKSVRFKVAEGCLKALSIGGTMKLDENWIDIIEVNLYEISLVAIPANPEALIDGVIKLRDLTEEDRKKYFLETAQAQKVESGVKNPTGLRIQNSNIIIKS